jgi:para-aminobenzoate synthetase/4-amino-4-deoxychorismate lyase
LLLASRRTDPADVFLYHKTTNRAAYDSDWAAATTMGYFDLLYLNSRGEITEGAITNIILEIDGKWYTPPLSSGILPGIWRMGELSSGRVVEKVLTIEDLHRASRVVVGNSVRGAMQVDAVIDASAESDLQTAFQCQLP